MISKKQNWSLKKSHMLLVGFLLLTIVGISFYFKHFVVCILLTPIVLGLDFILFLKGQNKRSEKRKRTYFISFILVYIIAISGGVFIDKVLVDKGIETDNYNRVQVDKTLKDLKKELEK